MPLFSRSSPERVRAAVHLAESAPDLGFPSLVPGVDNFRHDVHLSPRFIGFARGYILKLFMKHSRAPHLVEQNPGSPKPQERNEFKRLLQEVLLSALSRAKAAGNPDIDLLGNVALFKYLGWEMQQQYSRIQLEGKNKLRLFEGPRHDRNMRAFQLKEIFSEFQADKKNALRRISNELLSLVNEVQAGVVRKTRESFFGDEAAPWFPYFSHPLVFTENGRDDYLHLTKYVMLGNFHRDPDLYEAVEQWLKSMLKRVDASSSEARELEARQQEHLQLASRTTSLRDQVHPPDRGLGLGLGRLFGSRQESPPQRLPDLAARLEESDRQLSQSAELLRLLTEAYDMRLAAMLNAPKNVEELLGAARTEQLLAEARARKAPREERNVLEEKLEIQRHMADEFYNTAQQLGLLPCFAAAYEAAAIYQDYCPPIHPQQLKRALLDPSERKKVADLITHYKLTQASSATLEEAAARVRSCQPRDLRVLLVRFVRDFLRHHCDSWLLEVLQGLMERVNLVFEEKTQQLSRINNTLYEFLLSAEEKPQDEQILGHVILKADVRDSTRQTADLFARGLNPASHFSLNFYQPLNKLLPKYAAEKVFLEGDAVILAMFEKQAAALGGYPVARACGLAREIMGVVEQYNARAEKADLPRMQIGIGICWQNSAPMYLLDGENRIMISPAINLADRLSGCSKLARRALNSNQSLFQAFVFQTITEEAAAGAMEEFLIRYNTGICLSEEAFDKLQEEISLQPVELEMALLWQPEKVTLHCGSFPLPNEVFQRLVVREAQIPFVDARSFSLKEYTARRYYEVCTNHLVYQSTEKALGLAASP